MRILAALNAAFQLPVGLCAVVAPSVAAGLFALPIADGGPLTALVRMFGGLLASVGLLCLLLAIRPEQPLVVRRVLGAGLLLNVATDVLVLGLGELAFAQLAGGMILEAALGLVLLAPARSA